MNALHLMIRQTKDRMDQPDVDVLVKEVFEAIPTRKRAEMLRLALNDAVRHVLSQDRPFGPANFPSNVDEDDPQPEPVAVGGKRRPTASWRRDGLRAHWRRELREWVVIAEGSRKFLGECTGADLAVLAHRRYTTAKAVQAAGDRFAMLAEEIDRAKVTTVAELSATVLDKVFGQAA